MNTQSPLLPQGTTPPKGRSNVQIAVFSIVALHVVLIGGFLLIGCKDSTPPPAPPAALVDTNPPPALPVTPPAPVVTNPVPPTPPPSNTVVTPPHNIPDSTVPIVPPSVPTSGGKEYVVAKGDTLGGIAQKNHVSLKALEAANPGVNPLKLQIGITKIKIPESTATATAAPDTAAPDAGGGDTYVVKPGDALEKIAKSHGTTVKAIVELNHLKSMNSIKAGQKLKLPGAKATAPAPDATAPPAAAPAPAAPAPAAPATSTPPSN